MQDRGPAYCSIGLMRNTVAATATITATATAPVTIAIAAPAMGTRMYIHRDKKTVGAAAILPPWVGGGAKLVCNAKLVCAVRIGACV